MTNVRPAVRRSWRRALGALIWAILAWPGAAHALDPATRLQDYDHTLWTAREGAPSHIQTMIQTRAGWIILVTATGLYRFDGARFEPWHLPGEDLPGRGRLDMLHEAPNGDLAVNYAVSGGLALVHPDGRMEDLIAPFAQTLSNTSKLTTGPDGTLWAATGHGLHYFRGHRAFTSDLPAGLSNDNISGVAFEADGTMWVAGAGGVHLREPGATRFQLHGNAPGLASLIRAPNGEVWLAAQTGDRVERLSAPGPADPARWPVAHDPVESWITSVFDRDGNLWTANCPQRLCLTRPGEMRGQAVLHPAALAREHPDVAAAYRSGQPVAVMEDMAGAIWVATDHTIERFRDARLTPVHFPYDDQGVSLARDGAGRVWASDQSHARAWRLAPGGAVPDPVHAWQLLTNRPDGAMVQADKRTLLRHFANGASERIALPPDRSGHVVDMEVLGVQDDEHIIWMFTMQTGLVGYRDGRWQPRAKFNLPPIIIMSTPVGAGKIWFASPGGMLSLYDNGALTRYDAGLIGVPTNLDASAGFVISGDHGMAVLHGHTFARLLAADPAVLVNVSGIAVTSNGDRWLNGGQGVVHVRAADWQASMRNRAVPLRYELLGEHDGYSGHAYLDNRLPSAFADRDDQVWFATTEGLLHLDARKPVRPAVAPQVDITAFSSDGRNVALTSARVLPPLATNIAISFATPGAARPEDVRYQYRLAGEDVSWQIAGARRTAFFTMLAPGPHRFDVRAASIDGAWTSAPASLAFTVTPTLAQTGWFRALMAVLAAACLYGLYRWRVHAIAAQFQARMDERLDERNRIARELHDTLLQSIQGLLLKVQGVATRMAPDAPLRAVLETALTQAETTIMEGRSRVRSLRGEDAGLTLPVLLAAVARELASTASAAPAFNLHVTGAERALQPVAARELFAIGREALVNTFAHASAGAVTVTLDFSAAALRMLIDDDGRGIPADYAGANGRPGHWGIGGMQERARALGATIDIASPAGGGTRVAVALPARLAYAAPARRRWWRPALP